MSHVLKFTVSGQAEVDVETLQEAIDNLVDHLEGVDFDPESDDDLDVVKVEVEDTDVQKA